MRDQHTDCVARGGEVRGRRSELVFPEARFRELDRVLVAIRNRQVDEGVARLPRRLDLAGGRRRLPERRVQRASRLPGVARRIAGGRVRQIR